MEKLNAAAADESALKECFAILMRSPEDSVSGCVGKLVAAFRQPGEFLSFFFNKIMRSMHMSQKKNCRFAAAFTKYFSERLSGKSWP